MVPLALILANTSGANTAPSGERNRLKDLDVPAAVRAIVARSCADCHSGETDWPWYSNIPPVSWQIHSDVDNARAFMDLSSWNGYSVEERRGFASQIARATSAHVMPPPKYLWMHHDAKLSNADLDTLKDWALHQQKSSTLQP
jgi:cytochrome c